MVIVVFLWHQSSLIVSNLTMIDDSVTVLFTQVSSISGSGSSSSECDSDPEDEEGSVANGPKGRSRGTEDNSMTVQGSGRVPQLIFRSAGVF